MQSGDTLDALAEQAHLHISMRDFLLSVCHQEVAVARSEAASERNRCLGCRTELSQLQRQFEHERRHRLGFEEELSVQRRQCDYQQAQLDFTRGLVEAGRADAQDQSLRLALALEETRTLTANNEEIRVGLAKAEARAVNYRLEYEVTEAVLAEMRFAEQELQSHDASARREEQQAQVHSVQNWFRLECFMDRLQRELASAETSVMGLGGEIADLQCEAQVSQSRLEEEAAMLRLHLEAQQSCLNEQSQALRGLVLSASTSPQPATLESSAEDVPSGDIASTIQPSGDMMPVSQFGSSTAAYPSGVSAPPVPPPPPMVVATTSKAASGGRKSVVEVSAAIPKSNLRMAPHPPAHPPPQAKSRPPQAKFRRRLGPPGLDG